MLPMDITLILPVVLQGRDEEELFSGVNGATNVENDAIKVMMILRAVDEMNESLIRYSYLF